jgi:hypothetical protein
MGLRLILENVEQDKTIPQMIDKFASLGKELQAIEMGTKFI